MSGGRDSGMDEGGTDSLGRPLRKLQEWSETWPEWADGAATRVQDFDPDELSSGQVVGIAVGMAAALGGLLVALGPSEPPVFEASSKAARRTRTRVAARRAAGNRRRDRRAPTEVDGITLPERATLTLAPLAEGLTESAGIAAAQLAQGRTAMQGQLADLTERGGELTRRSRKELQKQAGELQKQIRILQKQMAKQSKRAGRKLPDTSGVRDAAAQAGSNVGQRFAAVGAATAAAASPLIERARHVELPSQVRGLADTTRERTVDLTGRVRDEFVPLVVERAGKVREEFVPLVADRASRVRKDVVPQVTGAASRIGQRFKEAGEESIADLAGVRQATVAALTAPPPSNRRSAVSTGIWGVLIAAIIGLVVYYLKDEERRQQFLNTAQSIAEQGREIIRDFQGYDEEF
jgi:ribosome recycling factor